jgi:hypothetical protein
MPIVIFPIENVPIESTNEPVATLKHGSSSSIRAKSKKIHGSIGRPKINSSKVYNKRQRDHYKI